jgi:hypothetical protein
MGRERVKENMGRISPVNFGTVLKWSAGAAITLWMIITIYQSFIIVDPDQYGFLAADVQSQMQNCTGNFQQRYDCKEEIIEAKQHRSFVVWGGKVALVFGPPAVLWFLVTWATRETKKKGPAPRARSATGATRRPAQPKKPVR